MVRLLRTDDEDETSRGVYTSVDQDFGVDISMPSLRPVIMKGKEKTGIVIHRQFVDICFSDRILLEQFPLSDGTVSFEIIISDVFMLLLTILSRTIIVIHNIPKYC